MGCDIALIVWVPGDGWRIEKKRVANRVDTALLLCQPFDVSEATTQWIPVKYNKRESYWKYIFIHVGFKLQPTAAFHFTFLPLNCGWLAYRCEMEQPLKSRFTLLCKELLSISTWLIICHACCVNDTDFSLLEWHLINMADWLSFFENRYSSPP